MTTPASIARACVAAALLAGCGQRVFDRLDGAAWPDRRPRVQWPDGGVGALTSDNGSDTLSLLDLSGPRTIGRYPIGTDPIGNDGPHHVVVDMVGRVVFTAFAFPPPYLPPGPHGNHGFATQPGILVRLALDDFREIARADCDTSPGDVVLTPDRRFVLVSHFDIERALSRDGGIDARRGSVIIFDANTLRRVRTVSAGVGVHGMAVTRDSRLALVTASFEDVLVVIPLDRPDDPIERIPVGPGGGLARYGPYSVVIDEADRFAYVGDREGRDVRRFDIAARQIDTSRVASVRASAMFAAIGPGGATLLVPTQNPDQLVVVRTDTMEIGASRRFTRPECYQPHQVLRGPDARYYLVCEGDHTGPGSVLVVNPDTLETLGRAEVGVYPDAIAFVTPVPGR